MSRPFLNAGGWPDEDAYNVDTGCYDKRKVKIVCPACQREWAPLCSQKTVTVRQGMRWVGCDHREPYATYLTMCRCGADVEFTIYTPQ